MPRRWGIAGMVIAVSALMAAGSASAKPGDVYVADLAGGQGTIWRIGPGGGTATSVASPPNFSPNGIAFDRSGSNLLAAENGGGAMLRQVSLSTGAVTTFLGNPPLSDPQDVVLAADGSILVSDDSGGPGSTPGVFRVDPVTKAITPIATGPPFDTTRGLAVKRDGTIFVAGLDSVFEISPSGDVTTLTPSMPALAGADGMALSPDEKTLYVASFDAAPDTIVRIDTATGAVSPFASFTDIISLALLPDRSVLATDDNAGIVYHVGPSGSPITTFSADPRFAAGELHDLVVEPGRCAGKFPTVVGTTGNDILSGSTFDDVFSTLGGKDTIKGLQGNDVICGGKGKDRILGGPGTDRLLGGPGRDRLLGQGGPDRLAGGGGRDRCRGGPGRDRTRSC